MAARRSPKKTPKKPAKRPAKKATKRPTKKAAKRPAKKAAKRPAKKATKRPAKKAAAASRRSSKTAAEEVPAFRGFTSDTVKFLKGLSRNNSKTWFEAHRGDYDAHYIEPAKAFVTAIGPGLTKISPKINAEPRVNGSIFRINRDTRFSKDKTPYKDHLDLWFWSGDKKGWDTPGFFLRITPKRLILGAGMHRFETPQLDKFRAAVVDAKQGGAVGTLVSKLGKAGYALGDPKYKKVPRGFDADHPRAALLRHGGLAATWDGAHPKSLGSAAFVNTCLDHFKALQPLNQWLAGALR